MQVQLIGATWCSECKSLCRILDKEGVKYSYVDADTPLGWETTGKYKVKGIPTIIIESDNITTVVTGKQKILDILVDKKKERDD